MSRHLEVVSRRQRSGSGPGGLNIRHDQLLKGNREAILHLGAKRGARNIRVFGSVARGEAGESSDIDFVVDFEPDRSLLDYAGLWLELQARLGCKVDVVSAGGIKPRLGDGILREAVPL